METYKKEEDGTHVLMFMDESYMHITHFDRKDFFRGREAEKTNRKSSKERRFIMMHAITKYGPLCERNETGRPIEDLLWTNPHHPNRKETDTLHPTTLGHPISPIAPNNSEG